MIRRLFLDHPREVGESYGEHFMTASRFGVTMIVGGLKAIVHGIFPSLCTTSGSDTVRGLHKIMVEKRGAKRDATVEMLSVEWVI